jgi:hypothetical protein
MKTKYQQNLLAAATIGALAFITTFAQAADAQKPNILYFHVDNTSVDDWGCYGGAYPGSERSGPVTPSLNSQP